MSPMSIVQHFKRSNGIHDRIIFDNYSGLPHLVPKYLFTCSLKELNGGDAIPLVLKTCAEFLEQQGILVCISIGAHEYITLCLA